MRSERFTQTFQVALSDVKTYLNSAGFVTDDPTALAIALG